MDPARTAAAPTVRGEPLATRRRDEARLVRIAFRSACKLEAELLLARDLGHVRPGDLESLESALREVKRMLGSLALRTYAQPPWAPDA